MKKRKETPILTAEVIYNISCRVFRGENIEHERYRTNLDDIITFYTESAEKCPDGMAALYFDFSRPRIG